MKGVDPKLRAQVWPYLLRLIDWNEELDNDRLKKMTEEFDKDLKDWTEMEKRIETMREQKGLGYLISNFYKEVKIKEKIGERENKKNFISSPNTTMLEISILISNNFSRNK